MKTEYKQDCVTLTADMDLNLAGPTVNASAVAGHQGWLGGYQMAFDTSKSALTKNNFAVGYSNGDFTLHTNVNDGQVSTFTRFSLFSRKKIVKTPKFCF